MLHILSLLGLNVTTAFVVVITTFLWWISTRPLPGVPPGPRPMLPILGNLLSIGTDPRNSFNKWRKKYGDVFSLYVGDKLLIVINSLDVLKEVFVKHGDVSNHRPHMLLMELLGNYKGVVTSSGKLWREQRKTALAIFRQLDVGKQSMEAKINEEMEYLVDTIDKTRKQPFDPTLLLGNAVSNITCSMLFGQRYEYENEDFRQVLGFMNQALTAAGSVALMNYFPFLKHLPGDLLKVKKLIGMRKNYEDTVLSPWVKSHNENFDSENCHSFMALYLKEMYKKQAGGEETLLDEENLKTITTDIFGAGTETTTTTLRWLILYMIHYPEIQEKCYDEVMKHVGAGRPPSIKDKDNLVYVEALYNEVLRCNDVLPFGAPHTVVKDMKFNGYLFPKNSVLITNIDSVLKDEKIWGDPLVFRPERFISKKGKFIKKDEFIPFFIGRRVCLGEAMSRLELFLFVARLIQRFKFVPEPGKPMPPVDGVFGLTYAPHDYKICAIPR